MVIFVLFCAYDDRDEEYHAADEKYHAADKACGVAVLHTASDEETSANQKKKPSPEMKLSFSSLAFT
ncbi:hypothetical protein ACFLW6_00785 [Chloroflexota bacterium]